MVVPLAILLLSAISISADPTHTNHVTRLAGSAHQGLRISSRLAVPRAAPSAPDGTKDFRDRRFLFVENSQIMQPRGRRQVTAPSPALPPLPPPVSGLLPLPIALPPPPPWPINDEGVFNVLQFGARADGRTDNTDAFRRTLQTACAWGEARSAYARVVVPAGGLFQTFPVELEGPCGAGLEVQVGAKRLGRDQATACVSDVLVRNVSFTGSNNALRIKTYQGGKGLVSNVTYRDIRVTDVTWPIIINQVSVV
ncbi:unnamed protein product [Closterium sp. NIES-53]